MLLTVCCDLGRFPVHAEMGKAHFLGQSKAGDKWRACSLLIAGSRGQDCGQHSSQRSGSYSCCSSSWAS